MSPTPSATNLARRTLVAFALVMLAWMGVWVLKSYLDRQFSLLTSESVSTMFWLASKIALWIVPAYLLIRMSGRNFSTEINLKESRRWFVWGIAVGLLIAIIGMIPKLYSGAPLFPQKFDYGTLNVLVIAPLFEEFLIRAAILGNLIPALGFAQANVVSAFCFVVLHIPGWYMMGSLTENTKQQIVMALSIFLLGLCFGWTRLKSRSFMGGSVAHYLNNLAA